MSGCSEGHSELGFLDLLLSLLGCGHSTAFCTTAKLLTTGSKVPTPNGSIRSASGGFSVTSMLSAYFVVVCLVFVLEFNDVGSSTSSTTSYQERSTGQLIYEVSKIRILA